MKYGLFDNEGDAWLGNEKGPFSYSDMATAEVAAEAANQRLRAFKRVEAAPFDDEHFNWKDEFNPDE
jgi:hypothetical protein